MALVVYKGPGGLPSAGDDEVTSNDQIVPSGKRFVGLVRSFWWFPLSFSSCCVYYRQIKGLHGTD